MKKLIARLAHLNFVWATVLALDLSFTNAVKREPAYWRAWLVVAMVFVVLMAGAALRHCLSTCDICAQVGQKAMKAAHPHWTLKVYHWDVLRYILLGFYAMWVGSQFVCPPLDFFRSSLWVVIPVIVFYGYVSQTHTARCTREWCSRNDLGPGGGDGPPGPWRPPGEPAPDAPVLLLHRGRRSHDQHRAA